MITLASTVAIVVGLVAAGPAGSGPVATTTATTTAATTTTTTNQPAWCADVSRQLAPLTGPNEPASSAVDALVASLPPLVGARARDDIGREGRLSAAVDAAVVAVRVGCAPVADTGAARLVGADPAAEVRALLTDERFAGVRSEDDFSEKLKDRLWRFLQELIASEGMQVFADNTRVIYLTFLAVVGGFVGVRLLRRSRRPRVDPATSSARVSRERQRTFAALRNEALLLLESLGDQPGTAAAPLDLAAVRRVMFLLRAAVLARVGEGASVVDAAGRAGAAQDAIRPSRTSSEVLARLPPAARAVVGPALSVFDNAVYGGVYERDDDIDQDPRATARLMLQLVDRAAASLSSSSSSRSPPEPRSPEPRSRSAP